LLSCCAVSAAAVTGTVSRFTEIGGGTPDRSTSPVPVVEVLDPKTTTVFSDRTAFYDASLCRTIGVESFEDLPVTLQTDTAVLSTAGFTITTDHPPRLGVWDRRFEGIVATDGIQWVGIEENKLIVPQVTTFTFDRPINHFGLYMMDYGDFGSDPLEFANDAGDVATAALAGQPSANRQYFGIINSGRSFRTVTLTHSNQGEFYGIDEVAFCWRGRPDEPISRSGAKRVSPD
jgi:hypothetical protein